MIKTLSPYYVTVPFVDPLTSSPCVNYTLRIYVWNGNKASVPATPSYVMTKTNATNSSASDKVNISRLINDFIDFKPRVVSGVALIDADNQVWCKTTISYDGGIEQLGVTKLCLKGYNYGMDGENATVPTNNILLQGDEFKVNRNGIFVLPILINEPAPVVPFATITNASVPVGNPTKLQISWTFPRPYIPLSITIQISYDNGANWINNTNNSTSPVLVDKPTMRVLIRLKSLYELETYSNTVIFQP